MILRPKAAELARSSYNSCCVHVSGCANLKDVAFILCKAICSCDSLFVERYHWSR